MVSSDATSLYTNIPIIDMLIVVMISLLVKRPYLKTSFFV